jgi:hypothetical protein
VRRFVPIVVLAAVFTSAAAAQKPGEQTIPAGTWYLKTTRATYSGAPAPVRTMLAKLMQNRITFQPLCTQTQCAVWATIYRPPSGSPSKLVLKGERGTFVGSKTLVTSLRCNGRRLRARLRLSVKTAQRLDEDVLIGSSEAVAVDPGGCALFGGKPRGVRRVSFTGSRN